jgi:hypothetical protein
VGAAVIQHLLVGVVTNRPRFWPWVQAQLVAASRATKRHEVPIDLLLCTENPEGTEKHFEVDIVHSPRWRARDRNDVLFTAHVPPDTALHARRNLVLEAARALGGEHSWLCWVDDDDLIAPSHFTELIRRVNHAYERTSGPHDVPWAVGVDEVTVVDAREPHASLGECPAARLVLPKAFCAFTQSAFHVPRCAAPGFEFPGKHRGSDTSWICGLRAEYGPPTIVRGPQTYLAIAHGSNRSNTAARVDAAYPLRDLDLGGAFPADALDVRHPAWRV